MKIVKCKVYIAINMRLYVLKKKETIIIVY